MPKVIKNGKFSRPSVNDILLAGRQRSNDISNYNKYASNDNTQVNNVIKKKYNTNRDKYLEPANKIGGYRALKTTAGKIGTALGAVPIAVAGVPALATSGEVAAPYLAKAAASTAIKPILTTLKNPWVDATLTSIFGAEPLSESYDNIKKGKFGVEDAINTLPVTAPLVGKGAQMLYKFKNKWIPKDYNSYLNERDFNTKVLYRNQDEFKKASDEIRGINKEINKTQPALNNVRKTIDDRDLIWKSYIKKQRESEPTYILRHKYLDKEIKNRLANSEIKRNDNIDPVFGNHYNLFMNRNGNLGNDLADFVDSNPDKFYYNTIKDFSKIPEAKLFDLKRKYDINLPYDRVNNRFNLTAAESPYTTGNISVPNFKTGKTETFYIPERFGKSTKYISGKYPFETGTVIGDPRIKHLPPQEYTRLTKDNIDEIIKNYLSEAKPFGSSALVSEGKINHGTHDYDFIMSFNDAKNHPDFNKWRPKRFDKSNRAITYGYEHPKYGELDINVIHENDGKAFGSLANELSIEQNPKLYADWSKKNLMNNKETDVVPQSAKELLSNMNPSDKTLLDMMFSDTPKHVDRFYDRLNYEDVNEVSKQIDNYYNVVLGGKYKKPNIPLSEFTDPEKNAKMLQGIKGIDVDKVKYEPERVKMLVEYIAGDRFFNGRGVDPRTDNTLLNSMTKWVAETYGGTANGVGLNTVVGGDSGAGNVYASIIPKGSKSYDDVKTLDDLRNTINHNTGNIKLSNEDKNFINKAIKEANEERLKQGLRPIQLDDDNNFNLSDVLEATEHQKGEPLKKLLNKIYERFNVPAIANREYGYRGRYASLTTDQDIDNIAQLFSRDIDRPQSILSRGYKLSTINSNELENTQRRIKEISKRSAYGKTKERIDDVALMKHLSDPDAYFDSVIETNRNMLKNKHKQQIIKEFNEKLQKDKIRYKNIGDILDYLKDHDYRKDRNAYSKIHELEDKLVDLNNERRYKTETFNSAKRNIRDAKDRLKDNPYHQLIRNEYYKYHDKLKSQDNKLDNFKNLININNMINSKKDRKKYAGGGKVPPAAASVRLQINPTNLPLPFTNTAPVMPLMKGWELRSKLMKERSIAEYQDWLNKADPQIINAVRKMKNTKEPLTPYIKAWTPEQKETLRREYEIKKENNSDETPYYEYGVKNDLIPGATCINTSTAAHGEAHPSNVDFAQNYKKYGYKRVDVNEMQPGDIIQLSTGGVPTHAMMATSTFDPIYKTFKTSQSHGGHAPSQMEHGKIFTIDPYQAQIRAAREDIKKGKKVDIKSLENDTRELPANIYHYLTPEGIMLYRKIPTTNNKNTYKFGGKITNKQDAIKSYKKPIPMDKIKYTPTIGVRIPSDSELRRQKEIESLTPNERYEYRRREAANEKRNNEFKALLNGFNNTFGRAASLASLIYGGGWAANRLIRGNKSSTLGQYLSKYMIPANTIDTYGDATQFITNPSLSNGIELGAGIVGKKYRDYGKKSRQLFELGTQGLNAYNSYKFGGDVKATPKRKHENNYIMKGTGNYVPKTPQEKVVVDLYNANYKSARRNMPREDALRQAHYRTTQQMMESGYGTSKQARKQNNYGGMGGSNSYNYKTINDFTDHVDTTLIKNFKNSYKAPTLKSYINGLYNGRIGAYSKTPIEIYDKEFRGTHPRTSKIIEQLNPDDYTMLDNMYNPYGNTNMMYAKYGCKVRPKAWIGAAISAVAGIASSLINANAQKKAAARQARAEEAAENRKYATDLTTQLNNSSAGDTQFYDQFKTEFKNGGKVRGYNPRITDGGIAIPIGHNTSLLRGSLHNEINETGNTGIGIKYGSNEVEAQDGEVVRKKKDKLLVYSNEDELGNGISPAKRILKGENKDKVFAMQENNKRRKGIVNNNKTFLGGGHMTFTKGDAYGAAANAVGNLASFFINNNAINKMSAGKAPILVSPTKLNTIYNANAQLANINKSRLRMKDAVNRNTSSSVAALGRLNDIENSAVDKVNQIYENKNNVESQLMNQDRMNAQSVRLQNASKMDEYNRRVAEMNNQKHLARAQNVTSLINGLAGTAEQTINNAEERYYKDKNLELAAAPYDDETMSKFLEIEGAVPENRIVETYLRNKDSQDPKKRALAELAFRRMNNFDESSKYNSYINQEYRNKAKLIGNNGYKVPTLGNINTNIRLNEQAPYYTSPLIARMLNKNNDFISYMNGYRY